LAGLQLNTEKLSPEAPGALGIIGGELDQDGGYALHYIQGTDSAAQAAGGVLRLLERGLCAV
jgi:hypothetical protein